MARPDRVLGCFSGYLVNGQPLFIIGHWKAKKYHQFIDKQGPVNLAFSWRVIGYANNISEDCVARHCPQQSL